MDPALYDASLRGRKPPFASAPLKYRFYTIITISIQNTVHILKVYNEYKDSLFEITRKKKSWSGGWLQEKEIFRPAFVTIFKYIYLLLSRPKVWSKLTNLAEKNDHLFKLA